MGLQLFAGFNHRIPRANWLSVLCRHTICTMHTTASDFFGCARATTESGDPICTAFEGFFDVALSIA